MTLFQIDRVVPSAALLGASSGLLPAHAPHYRHLTSTRTCRSTPRAKDQTSASLHVGRPDQPEDAETGSTRG
jgi:hypothetical protein